MEMTRNNGAKEGGPVWKGVCVGGGASVGAPTYRIFMRKLKTHTIDRSNNTLIKDLRHRTRRKWNESPLETLWRCSLRITVTHYTIGSQIRDKTDKTEKWDQDQHAENVWSRKSETEWERVGETERKTELKGECESCWVNFLAYLWCTAHPHTRTITHWPYTRQTLKLQYSIMYEGKPRRAADNLGLLHDFTKAMHTIKGNYTAH